eukprot:scaffold25549_cov69-Phaeocystis_antarctica.AAC.1
MPAVDPNMPATACTACTNIGPPNGTPASTPILHADPTVQLGEWSPRGQRCRGCVFCDRLGLTSACSTACASRTSV